MNSRPFVHSIVVGGAFCSLLLTQASSARAADDDSEPAAAATPPPSATPGAKAGAEEGSARPATSAATPAPQAPPVHPVAETMAPPFGILRLPPSGYPEVKIRGLRGGSLWLTFHGQQWPYVAPALGEASTVIGVSGNLWVDTAYEKITRSDTTQGNTEYWLQQARGVLRVTPTYTTASGWFVQGQAELVANKDQTLRQPDVADVDDLWIRLGKWKTWDLQVGRYEAWELYHFGMGLDYATIEREGARDAKGPPSIYGVNYGYYRPAGVGNVAAHIYPTDWLRFELMGQMGNESGLNTLATRPAAILDFGMVKLKGGLEYRHQTPQAEGGKEERTQRGGGGGIQLIFAPYVEAGFNGAMALVDHTDPQGKMDGPGSYTTSSMGGFANVHIYDDILVGGGVNYTYLENLHRQDIVEAYTDDDGNDATRIIGSRVGEFSHLQGFGALQYIVMKQLYVKLVVAYAQAILKPTFEGQPTDPPSRYDTDMVSARLRLQYLF